MMKLYAISGTCSLAPHIVLEIIGEPFELKLLDRENAEQKSPEYLAINPRGRVPALQVGDDIILENAVIQYYLAMKFEQAKLAPSDPMERIRWLTFLTWCSNSVHISFRRFRRPELYLSDETARKNLSENGKQEFLAALKEIDTRLEGRQWIFGGRLSTADTYIQVFHHWARISEFPIDALSNLRKHGDAMLALPAVRRAFEREGLSVFAA
jgi:glutathione S-transferase